MKPPFLSQYSLENDIFNGLCGFAFLTMGLYTLHDFLVVDDPVFLTLDCLLLALLGTGYFLSRKLGSSYCFAVPFSIIIMVLLGIFYFFLGGLKGTLPFYFILFSFSFSILLKGMAWKGIVILFSLTLAFLVGIQLLYPELITNVYEGNTNLDLIISFFISLSFTIYGTRITKSRYDAALERIVSQNYQLNIRNEEIKKKNKELKKKREETEALNIQLNLLLEQGTEKLREQHRRLLQYAFINSHKVRGPLARVLGLAELLKTSENEEDRKLFLEKLYESASELDKMVIEMNQVLHNSIDNKEILLKEPADTK